MDHEKHLSTQTLHLQRLIILGAIAIALTSCIDQTNNIWEHHRSIMHRVQSREYVNEDEMRNSLNFFISIGHLSGIPVRFGEVGLVHKAFPTSATWADLQQLDEWYKKNRHRLVWDDDLEMPRLKN